MLPELAKVIWPLKAGEVFPRLVRGPLGFHIVKVTAHENAGDIPLSEVQPTFKLGLLQSKQEQLLSSWLQDKRQQSAIVLGSRFASLVAAETAGGKSTAH